GGPGARVARGGPGAGRGRVPRLDRRLPAPQPRGHAFAQHVLPGHAPVGAVPAGPLLRPRAPRGGGGGGPGGRPRAGGRGAGARVGEQVELLRTSRGAAVAALRRSGHGCRWLAGQLREYAEVLRVRGFWTAEEATEVVRLFGADPDEAKLGTDATAYRLVLS